MYSNAVQYFKSIYFVIFFNNIMCYGTELMYEGYKSIGGNNFKDEVEMLLKPIQLLSENLPNHRIEVQFDRINSEEYPREPATRVKVRESANADNYYRSFGPQYNQYDKEYQPPSFEDYGNRVVRVKDLKKELRSLVDQYKPSVTEGFKKDSQANPRTTTTPTTTTPTTTTPTTTTPAKKETTVTQTTKSDCKKDKASSDQVVYMSDLMNVLEEFRKKISCTSPAPSGDFNQLPPASAINSPSVINLLDMIQLGRGQAAPSPPMDNINWLKIKVPF